MLFQKFMRKYSRVLNYLNKSDFCSPQRFGFQANHSSSSALIFFNDYVTKKRDNDEILIFIFIDFSKAFDTLDHKILLKKLNNLVLEELH